MMNQNQYPKRKLYLSLAQYGLRTLESEEDFWNELHVQIERARANQADVLVFPEYLTAHLLSLAPEMSHEAACEYLDQFTARYLVFFKEMSCDYGIHILAGTHIFKKENHFVNRAYFFSPDGTVHFQDKIHLTPEEQTKWPLTPGHILNIIDTAWGKMAIFICYDIEFPELARLAAEQGAQLILCPSYTDNAFGYFRVRLCAQARAIENQLYVALSGIVGELTERRPQLDWGHCQAGLFSPCDVPFEADGIIAIGQTNQHGLVFAQVDLEQLALNRSQGLVAPFFDRKPHLYSRIRAESSSNSPTS